MNLDRLTEHRRVIRDAGWNGAADAMTDAHAELAAVIHAIRDYHLALDQREHGGVAAHKAIEAIQTALNMPWTQGAEAARRATQQPGSEVKNAKDI